MLKNKNTQASGRKIFELRGTPGETVRDAIISAGVKAANEAAYAAGNETDTVVEIAKKAGAVVDGGTALFGGGESAHAFGKVAFKTTKDLARGDKVCTGLCLVSGTCELVALGCTTIKVIPVSYTHLTLPTIYSV